MTIVTATSVSVTGNPSLPATPTGNPAATFASLNCQASAANGSTREFLVDLGFASAQGNGTAGDKVTLYSGMVGNPGTADIWAINSVTTMGASSGNYNATGYEIDFNNLNAERGDADGAAGLSSPVAVGLAVSGAGNVKSTAAISIEGPGSPIWNRGIVVGDRSVAQSTLQDLGTATISLDIRGSHTYAVDTSLSAGTPLRIPNNQTIVARNAAATGDIPIAKVDVANNINLGSTSSSFVVSQANFIPARDNTFACGFGTNRWTEVFAVNGTIQTADPRLMADIKPLPSAESSIKAIHPVTYRWKADGAQSVDSREDVLVHETEWRDVEEEVVVVGNGKAVRTLQKRQAEVYLYDEIPLEDQLGNPVTVTIPEQRDASGTLFQASLTQQVTHRVPRMVTKSVTVNKPVAAPGVRNHWGFLGPEVKAAFDTMGMDFGGHVRGDDGVHHLRPDQLIPILWKATQELFERVQTLEARSPEAKREAPDQ